jgi:hypothetical protein
MAIIIIAAIATTSSTTNVMAATANKTVMSTAATTGTTAATATATPTTTTVMSEPDPAISRQEAQRGGQWHRVATATAATTWQSAHRTAPDMYPYRTAFARS